MNQEQFLEQKITHLEADKQRLESFCEARRREYHKHMSLLGLDLCDSIDEEELKAIGKIVEGIRFLIRKHRPSDA